MNNAMSSKALVGERSSFKTVALSYGRLAVLPIVLAKAASEAVVRVLLAPRKQGVESIVSLVNDFLLVFFLHVYGRARWEWYRFSTQNSQCSQEKTLAAILKKNANTEYGKEHGFGSIASVQEFQQGVPVVTYANMESRVERMTRGEKNIMCEETPVVYATTSGTTAKPKYLPVTPTSVKRGHKLSQLLWMHRLYQDAPSFVSGKILAIVSAAIEGYLPDGTPYGSATGFISRKVPRIMRKKYALPAFTAEISDYNAKYYFILRTALEQTDITYLTTANPSTVALLCQKMVEWTSLLIEDIHLGTLRSDIVIEPEIRAQAELLFKPNPNRAAELVAVLRQHGELTPQHVWPHLKTVGCWTGGNSGTFLNSMKRYFSEDVAIRDIGYLASELKGSIPLHANNSAGALALADTFFEFVEVEEWNNASHWKEARFLLPHELEVGKPYYIFVTNNSGLYRYDINDIVQVKSFHDSTPEIVFLQKGKGATNITGEKLYESQIVSAVEFAKSELNLDLYFYLCVANTAERRYELLAEFNKTENNHALVDFVKKVDETLQNINMEYATKRSSLRLGDIALRRIVPGGFANYRAKRVREGQREGQFKMVILTADSKILNDFDYAQ